MPKAMTQKVTLGQQAQLRCAGWLCDAPDLYTSGLERSVWEMTHLEPLITSRSGFWTQILGDLYIKSLFCLLGSHKYSINLQLGIRESKLNSFSQGPNILRLLRPSKPPFPLGTPWKGDPGVCELYSFAQRKVFVLKRKRLWLLLALVLDPFLPVAQGGLFGDILCQETPCFIAWLTPTCVQLTIYIISIPESLPWPAPDPLPQQKWARPPLPQSSRTPSFSAYLPSIPPAYHSTDHTLTMTV